MECRPPRTYSKPSIAARHSAERAQAVSRTRTSQETYVVQRSIAPAQLLELPEMPAFLLLDLDSTSSSTYRALERARHRCGRSIAS